MKLEFYLDVFTKFLIIIALIIVGYRIENMVKYNRNAIEKHVELSSENLKLNKLQLEKLEEMIKCNQDSIEYNKHAIEYNTEFNKKQIEKLDKIIKGEKL